MCFEKSMISSTRSDGELDYIVPKLKKKFGGNTGSNSVSSSSHRVPTQDELQEPRSPKEADDEVVERHPPGAVFSTGPLGHRGSCKVILEPGPPGNVTRNYVMASLCMYPYFFLFYWMHNLFQNPLVWNRKKRSYSKIPLFHPCSFRVAIVCHQV